MESSQPIPISDYCLNLCIFFSRNILTLFLSSFASPAEGVFTAARPVMTAVVCRLGAAHQGVVQPAGAPPDEHTHSTADNGNWRAINAVNTLFVCVRVCVAGGVGRGKRGDMRFYCCSFHRQSATLSSLHCHRQTHTDTQAHTGRTYTTI